jgi:hypothetical protein
MLVLQQRVRRHGLRLIHAKVLLHTGLWVAVAEAVVHLTMPAVVVEEGVQLQLVLML